MKIKEKLFTEFDDRFDWICEYIAEEYEEEVSKCVSYNDIKDFISQTRQADVEWLIQYIVSNKREEAALVCDNHKKRDNYFYNLALNDLLVHLEQIKETI